MEYSNYCGCIKYSWTLDYFEIEALFPGKDSTGKACSIVKWMGWEYGMDVPSGTPVGHLQQWWALKLNCKDMCMAHIGMGHKEMKWTPSTWIWRAKSYKGHMGTACTAINLVLLVVGRQNPEIRKIKLSGNWDLEEYTTEPEGLRDSGRRWSTSLPINFFALLGTEQSFPSLFIHSVAIHLLLLLGIPISLSPIWITAYMFGVSW